MSGSAAARAAQSGAGANPRGGWRTVPCLPYRAAGAPRSSRWSAKEPAAHERDGIPAPRDPTRDGPNLRRGYYRPTKPFTTSLNLSASSQKGMCPLSSKKTVSAPGTCSPT